MKKIVTAAAAALMVTGSVALADDAPTPQMPVEIVTQDSAQIGADQAGGLVPILALILFFLVMTGGTMGDYPA